MLENPHRNLPFWHKVQVHCHSQESDARRGQTPKVVEEAYRATGYSCVFLTDHNRVTPGPGVPGVLHVDSAEYAKGRHHTLALGIDRNGNQTDKEATTGCACANIPRRLTYIAKDKGAIPVVAHPNARHFCSGRIHPLWCGGGWSPQEMTTYARQFAGLEIFNANNAARRMWGLNRWDEVLASGARRVWGFASDDCHDVRDDRMFDRGWIQVNSEIDPADYRNGLLTPDAFRRDLLQNIRGGNFWAMIRLERHRQSRRSSQADTGALSLNVFCSQGQVRVVADRPCETIEFRAGSSSRQESAAISEAADFAYEVGGWEDYVRIRVVQKGHDGQRYVAFSQPLSVQRT